MISLCLDLLIKLQAVRTSLLPSGEHILSIRIEDASSFSTPFRFREVTFFDPPFDGSPAQPHAASNLCETETLFVESYHLLIAIIALFATGEAGTFITQFGFWLPVFHGNYFRVLKEKWFGCFDLQLLLSHLSCAFSDLCPATSQNQRDGFDQIFI